MPNSFSQGRADRSWFTNWGAVIGVLAISLLATVLAWQYEVARVMADGQARFERSSRYLQDDVISTMNAYAQFLRGGVGLVHATETVTRSGWHKYVSDADLQRNYPGIQGVSINGFVQGQDALDGFLDTVRQRDWPEFVVKPGGTRDVYAPVLFLEPLDASNERAIGFDIYSEPTRRAAVDEAVASGRPIMTAKIELVQDQGEAESGDVPAGVLLILPTYRNGVDTPSASLRRANTTGLIVSVFRLSDLIGSAFAARGQAQGEWVRLEVFDGDGSDVETQLFGTKSTDAERFARFTYAQTLNVYGRDWTFQMASSPAFEKEVASASPMIVLGAGVLLSLLLTSLVLGQSQRAYETEQTADKLSSSQQHIELLMGEVNHRSKNLLSLVQAIARQTKADDPTQFVSQFSERVRALAASQDLLVKNGWKGISLNDLIDSQLAHFEDLLGNRIQLDGPDIDISAEASQTLGMAFHELATNAGKYGALSNDVGTVDIRWALVSSPSQTETLTLSWVERGGPPVVPPSRTGFGAKVTDMMVKYALKGEVEILFNPSGFVWNLSCPTHRIFENSDTDENLRGEDLKVTA